MKRSSAENSSCWKVGLRIQLPSTWPTRTAAIGPFHGIGEMLSAVEAASTPSTSASFSWSAEMTVTNTWISFLNPSGKSGRIDRSMPRRGKDFLVRRTAFALEEPARDLAGGVGLLAILDRQGEEREGGDVLGDGHRRQNHGVAEANETRAGGLLRHLTGLDREGPAGEFGFDPMHSHNLFFSQSTQCKEGVPSCSVGTPSPTGFS